MNNGERPGMHVSVPGHSPGNNSSVKWMDCDCEFTMGLNSVTMDWPMGPWCYAVKGVVNENVW